MSVKNTDFYGGLKWTQLELLPKYSTRIIAGHQDKVVVPLISQYSNIEILKQFEQVIKKLS